MSHFPAWCILCLAAFLSLNPIASADAQEAGAPPNASLASSLGVGDTIRVKVWREPDLSGEATVGQDGTLALPRLGRLQALEMTTDAIRQLIIDTYSSTLVDPAIEVTILRRVRVLGAVRMPGLYSIEDGLTVADAIAIAGGVTDEGNYEKVRLVSGGERFSPSADALARVRVNSGDEVSVGKLGWGRRNSASLVATALTAVAIVAAGQ